MNRLALLVAACALLAAAAPAAAQIPRDVTTTDVCAAVPGARVALALGGTLADATLVRPAGTHARCRYSLKMPAGKGPGDMVLVLWLHAPSDFDALRKAHDTAVQAVDGLGDSAFLAFDKASDRYDLFVLLSGVATLQATGPTVDSVRRLATTAGTALRTRRLRR